MTTSPPPPPPPPPPPGPSEWPSSQPSQPAEPAQPWPPSQPASTGGGSGRQKWWTGGRILAAIVIVLVLMGGSAAAGFLAGSTWGPLDDFADGLDIGEVPGSVPVDSPAAEGESLRPGSRVSGAVADRAVEHTLTVASARDVELEIIDADFDTVLVLLDSSGGVVQADDDGGEETNSAMRVSLSAGTYRVRVQPWSAGSSGGYTLAVD